jgi:hypothetical protein
MTMWTDRHAREKVPRERLVKRNPCEREMYQEGKLETKRNAEREGC